MSALRVGDVLFFKAPFHVKEYGLTAKVVRISEAISRPYGAITTLVDLVSENGRELQWRRALVNLRLKR